MANISFALLPAYRGSHDKPSLSRSSLPGQNVSGSDLSNGAYKLDKSNGVYKNDGAYTKEIDSFEKTLQTSLRKLKGAKKGKPGSLVSYKERATLSYKERATLSYKERATLSYKERGLNTVTVEASPSGTSKERVAKKENEAESRVGSPLSTGPPSSLKEEVQGGKVTGELQKGELQETKETNDGVVMDLKEGLQLQDNPDGAPEVSEAMCDKISLPVMPFLTNPNLAQGITLILDALRGMGLLTTQLNSLISNPEISNPEISNPEISNPEISNPEISNNDANYDNGNCCNSAEKPLINLGRIISALTHEENNGQSILEGIADEKRAAKLEMNIPDLKTFTDLENLSDIKNLSDLEAPEGTFKLSIPNLLTSLKGKTIPTILSDTLNPFLSQLSLKDGGLMTSSQGGSDLLKDSSRSPFDLSKSMISFNGVLNQDNRLQDMILVRETPVHVPTFLLDVAEKVTVGFVRLSAKQGEMEIHLNPPELGTLTVKVSFEDGTLKAHFVTPQAEVKHVLDQNLANLRQMLEAQGLSIQDLFVSLKERGDHSRFAQAKKMDFASGIHTATNAISEANGYQLVGGCPRTAQVDCLA